MQNDIDALIKATMENLKSAGAVDNAVGRPIALSDGSTLIPMTKISIAFASGGGDYNMQHKTDAPMQFAGAGGGGVTITPIGFLSCFPDEDAKLFKWRKDGDEKMWERLVGIAIGALKK